MTYVDGFVLPVPESKLRAYREMAESAVPEKVTISNTLVLLFNEG